MNLEMTEFMKQCDIKQLHGAQTVMERKQFKKSQTTKLFVLLLLCSYYRASSNVACAHMPYGHIYQE